MDAKHITPIVNVSDITASFLWFEKWGWRKCWDWGSPATFGAVGSGECEIFLCQGGQGGRGKGANPSTFGPNGDETADKGAWMSVWVDDVDEVHRQCLAAGLEVTFPPTDMPWNVREMHVRHPDGHVFRISKGIEHGSSVSASANARRLAYPPRHLRRVGLGFTFYLPLFTLYGFVFLQSVQSSRHFCRFPRVPFSP
jgi:catechol 2,3-dioxygenase-like lactoylglutathione lyase family enzyme